MQTLNITKKYEKYPEYKDSGVDWLGKIPKGWRVGKVKETFNLLKEKSFNNSESEILSLTLNGIKTRDVSNNEGQIASSYEGYRKIIKGDIVLNPMDLVRGFVDSSKYEGIISPAYSTLRKIDKNTNSDFYGYFFQKHYFEGIFYPFGNGVSVDHRWTLKDDTLMNFPLLVIPEKEQTKIANYLDEKIQLIDKIIEKKEKLIDLLKEKRTAVINNAVNKGLDKSANLVDSLFGEIPSGWKISKFRNISNFIKTGTTPSTENSSYFEGSFDWFTPGDFSSDILLNSNRKINESAIKDGECKLFPKNSVLMVSIGATLGKVAYSEKEFSCNQQINVIYPNKESYYKYLYYFILINTEFIKSNSLITTIGILNQNRLKNIEVLVPSINEQIDITEYLDEKCNRIKNSIKKIENSIELLKEFKTSLISNVVTGKIKIIS